MKLSIIIPAYNEQERISKTIEDYHKFFNKKLKKEFEIIIIPNNCKDNTSKIAEDFSKEYKEIRYKNCPYFIGKGGAILEGFKMAKGDLIGFVDADNSTKPEEYYKLIVKIEDYDCIIASRYMKSLSIKKERSLVRNIYSKIFNITVRILFNLEFKDTQCGAKILKNKAAKAIIKDIIIKKWAFDIDLLYSLKKRKFKIKEIPIKWSESKGTKLTFWTPYEMMLSLLKLRFSK